MAYEPALGIERLCTIKEIAEQAGVGLATVHRVLKGHRKVASTTAQRVLDAIEDLNCRKVIRAFQGAPGIRRGTPDQGEPESPFHEREISLGAR